MGIWKTEWGWRAEFLFRGQRIIKKGFFKYKDEARLWIQEEKLKLKEELKRPTSQDNGLSLWELSQKYLSDCKTNFSEKTFGEKRFCLERFYKLIGDVLVDEVKPSHVLDFINERAKTQSNYAANKDRKNLKAFYHWIQGIYGIMHDPTAPISKKAHTKKARRLIPIQDILKVMLMSQGHDRVLIGTYWHTGARKGELLRLTWAEDINFEERWIRLGTKKSRDRSMVYQNLWMNDDLCGLLKWQWDNRHPTSPYVFCHMNPEDKNYGKPYVARWKMLKKLCRQVGVEEFGYHDIRHTVAKYLNDLQKVGLKKVQQVMRHRRQSTTEIYVEGNYSDTKEALTLLELDNLKSLSEIHSVFHSESKKVSSLSELTF